MFARKSFQTFAATAQYYGYYSYWWRAAWGPGCEL